MERVRVVIPSYFDLDSAHEIAHELVLDLIEYHVEIILLDETLGQQSLVCEKRCPLKIIIPSQRLGQQRQIVRFLKAQTVRPKEFSLDDSFLVVMDADGEDNPAHVRLLLEKLKSTSADLVIAKRLGRKTGYQFKLGYFAFKLFSWLLTGNWVSSGSFSVSKSDWLMKEMNNPTFNHSFAGGLLGSNGTRQFVKLERSKRRYGNSRVNTNKLIMHGLDFLLAQISDITARLFLFFSVGSAIGFLAIGAAFIGKVQGWATEGWATLLIMGSLQISILLGILFLISFVQYGFMNNQNLENITYSEK
jgi:hypothetical protein